MSFSVSVSKLSAKRNSLSLNGEMNVSHSTPTVNARVSTCTQHVIVSKRIERTNVLVNRSPVHAIAQRMRESLLDDRAATNHKHTIERRLGRLGAGSSTAHVMHEL